MEMILDPVRVIPLFAAVGASFGSGWSDGVME
jgi:hypothetical protein